MTTTTRFRVYGYGVRGAADRLRDILNEQGDWHAFMVDNGNEDDGAHFEVFAEVSADSGAGGEYDEGWARGIGYAVACFLDPESR
jgi:hypothetical protein